MRNTKMQFKTILLFLFIGIWVVSLIFPLIIKNHSYNKYEDVIIDKEQILKSYLKKIVDVWNNNDLYTLEGYIDDKYVVDNYLDFISYRTKMTEVFEYEDIHTYQINSFTEKDTDFSRKYVCKVLLNDSKEIIVDFIENYPGNFTVYFEN